MTDEETLRQCRRCLLLQSGKDDVLADIKSRIAAIPPKDRTPEDLYGARLERCAGCDHLVSGTCLKCGCYPEFRAAFIRNGCPVKNWEF